VIFKPYYYFETGCAAYLFGCGGLGKCAVVDAHEEDVDDYAAFAESKGMRITHVIDTHVHADHRSGGPALSRKVGATYCLHESADVALAFEALKDGQEIEKRWNPLLSKSREESVDALCDVPPKPAEMAQIIRINQGREGNTP
jgi:glyoxylase-like metal-dependent hydrolase (beta-lactamase superfamily II)